MLSLGYSSESVVASHRNVTLCVTACDTCPVFQSILISWNCCLAVFHALWVCNRDCIDRIKVHIGYLESVFATAKKVLTSSRNTRSKKSSLLATTILQQLLTFAIVTHNYAWSKEAELSRGRYRVSKPAWRQYFVTLSERYDWQRLQPSQATTSVPCCFVMFSQILHATVTHRHCHDTIDDAHIHLLGLHGTILIIISSFESSAPCVSHRH